MLFHLSLFKQHSNVVERHKTVSTDTGESDCACAPLDRDEKMAHSFASSAPENVCNSQCSDFFLFLKTSSGCSLMRFMTGCFLPRPAFWCVCDNKCDRNRKANSTAGNGKAVSRLVLAGYKRLKKSAYTRYYWCQNIMCYYMFCVPRKVHWGLTRVSTVVCLTMLSSLCSWFLVGLGPALFFSTCFCITHRADYKYIRLITHKHMLCVYRLQCIKQPRQSVRQDMLLIRRLTTAGFRCSISCSALLIFSCSISLLMVCLA